ncbi:MAG: P27 family phage terminase small subunit [Rhodospirillales bacterium]|nr:P27 family phage terminase small subunit [Rhodospirillales bacterium]
MSTDTIKIVNARSTRPIAVAVEGGFRQTPTQVKPTTLAPPSILMDEIAHEEWERVSDYLCGERKLSMAHRSLLVGYCNAVARAIRAERILAAEGRYYETKTRRGFVLRRRHPAAQDAEEGWTSARHLAKQLGLTGGNPGEQQGPDPRRRVFK